jgi:hypothetical protein
LVLAAAQGGKALEVGLALWLSAGIAKTRTVALSSVALQSLGVSRHAAYRGLARLEAARLVTVVRHRGRQPRVTVLEVPAS